ncbi:MAG: gliding motility-associated C-terminal domain-containing protein [Bacteroidales bacterium]|nr:gliding motility-associated C-terminal domain-containing protein [Bacteroidales bacterium]
MMRSILTLILISCLLPVFSMNVKSLEISYENVSGLTYRANAVFYLYDPSPIDTSVVMNWGDNTFSYMLKTGEEDLPGELKKITYSGTHTFSGPSTFNISLSYSVRSTNVNNIPFSLITDIYVDATIVANPFLGSIHSPVFVEPPQLNVCNSQPATLNLVAIDPDGDELRYSIINCRGDAGMPITGFSNPSATSGFSIDQNTGILSWDSPSQKGFYNFAVLVEKFRNGIFVGNVMRDILVNVIDCNPDSATLYVPDDTCVIAGNLFEDTIYATYNGIDTIALTGYGEPLLLNPPATFNQPVRDRDSVASVFSWNVSCEHVRPAPYTMFFSASLEDSLSNCACTYTFNNQSLSTFYASGPVSFTNPCFNGWDNSFYLWFGADSAAPRFVSTPAMDVSAGNYMIVFDMIMAEHTGNPGTDCEGPDEPDEGIYLQYSLNGLAGPWNNMAYWDPSLSPNEGGHVENLIRWNNYSIVVPDAAYSTATRFRWIQFDATGTFYDHWGLDNILVYKISDNLPSNDELNISVIAPAPQNLTANAITNTIQLEWDKETCTNASGYHIYRKSSFYGYVPGYCETGVPAYTGYSLIASTNSISDTTFLDDNNGMGLPAGNEYCYMITAWFENGAESQASNEACAQLPDDVPLITNVSVNNTDAVNGSMYIAWSKPDDFDTLAFAGPYRYDIYRADNFSGAVYAFIGSTPSINDTTFTDTLFNTLAMPYHYRVDLMYAAGSSTYQTGGQSYPASSVYLNIYPFDQSLLLDWNFNVPWTNDSFVVYRYNPVSFVFDSIAITAEQQFLDTGLINGSQYCYKIKSVGAYSLSGFINPIINYSQIACMEPSDLEPPCATELEVESNCDDISNLLTWLNPESICGSDDVGLYEIYYSLMPGEEMILIATVSPSGDTSYLHNNISSVAGCYAVIAVDTNNNSSLMSNVVCVDIDLCDLYQLPNVFTPNGDGHNDYFMPFPYDFVEEIDIQIFNRWGNVVFQTTDPDIMWDGKDMHSGNDCSEGVYFYLCDVYELTLSGLHKRTLTGTVHLYRN